ncbi:hypothetical protein PoB_006087000 [Plakobranchus ocellatus]|uniref:Uncharacterized protein n=1 Tax=Plakobranchus ocellatus TaxID=259542 RepID=A0AAV4CR15_9GAST|nr:hypothetical protein PoB_006087000 [Plakobranchus ocellatus]
MDNGRIVAAKVVKVETSVLVRGYWVLLWGSPLYREGNVVSVEMPSVSGEYPVSAQGRPRAVLIAWPGSVPAVGKRAKAILLLVIEC